MTLKIKSRFALLTILVLNCPEAGASTIFTSSASFFSSVGFYLTDDYQHLDYMTGDIEDQLIVDRFTNNRMSAIFGETIYRTTGFPNNYPDGQTNSVAYYGVGNERYYCGGCNGSFQLDFTATSVGDGDGVYGVGLNVGGNIASFPFYAYVIFSDNTSASFLMPIVEGGGVQKNFWGITSDTKIRTIDFGGYNGAAVAMGSFLIDDLTIAASIPTQAHLPSSQWLSPWFLFLLLGYRWHSRSKGA